jgi:solute:Na+ symporter, SSS family
MTLPQGLGKKYHYQHFILILSLHSLSLFNTQRGDMQNYFHFIDWTILVVYLGSMVGLGAYFSRKESSTENFFLGGRNMPWWAVGISIFATQLSAITYIAIPGRAFETDWSWAVFNMGAPIVGLIVILFFLPAYRARRITSVYEFLEARFSPSIRAYGALTFVIMQMGRIAIVLYLPALVLYEVTGLPVEWMILVMGILVTIYTVLGGIEVVIWTDVVQTVILISGAVLALILICMQVDGGIAEVISIGAQNGKFQLAHFDPSVSKDILWFLLIGAIFTNLVPYASDQTLVQRYFTTSTEKDARRCLWLSVWIVIPSTILFFFVGTSLYAFYSVHPELLKEGVEWDRVFPYFIVRQMPIGVSGLLIAAIFAGAMSSLDSSLNSISTVCVTDFYKRFINQQRNDHFYLSLARWITVIMGAVGTVIAIWVARRLMGNPDQKGAWDFFIAIQGILGGGLAGIFCVGVFTHRAHWIGVAGGVIISAVVLIFVKYNLEWHSQTYAATGILVAFAASYIISRAFPLEQSSMPDK